MKLEAMLEPEGSGLRVKGHFLTNAVLNLSQDEYSMDSISWKLALSLFGAWTIIFFCMIRGSKSFGKVVYVTATFPYLVLTILLIRGATLPGSKKGILFYVIPDFKRLSDPVVWFDAASQIFYSLGCGMGTLATFGSFNDFKKKNKGDAYVVAFGNSLTSIYAGFAIFCILGFMAADAGVGVGDVAADGSGLAFIAYPQAVSRMPISQLWSVLFFVMLLALGIGSMFGPVEVVMTIIQDTWPRLRKFKVFLLGGLILLMYFVGLALTTDIGIYILTICNDYNAYAIVLVSIIELMTVAFIYGVKRFVSDIELMLDIKLGLYWKITWTVTAPFLTLAVVIYSFILHQPSVYGKKPLPGWMNDIGWGVVVISMIPVPIVMVMEILKNRKSSRVTFKIQSHLRFYQQLWKVIKNRNPIECSLVINRGYGMLIMNKSEDSDKGEISRVKVELNSLLMGMNDEIMAELPIKDTCLEVETSDDAATLNPKKRKITTESDEKTDDIDVQFFKIASSRMDSYATRMGHIQNNFMSLDEKLNVIHQMLTESSNPSIYGVKNIGIDNKTIIVPVPKTISTKEMNDSSVSEEKSNGTDSLDVNSLVPPGQYGQVLKLNNEEDYPNGSWLGDSKKNDSRVRCHILPRNLLYVEQENKTAEKMALALLDYLFDKETQASSNLSGQGKHGKKMLNPLFIYGIQCHLKYKFGINTKIWQKIKQSLDSKCRTAFNRKHKGLPLTTKHVHNNVVNSAEKCQNQLEVQDVSYLIENSGLIETDQGYLRVLQLNSDQIAELQQTNQIVINGTDSIISYVTDTETETETETPPTNITAIDHSTYIVKEKDG
ncbi:Sodium- and chloride-dependent glycine transporter 2 [Nymphon striatum]|nr:Sodium- and chloride-dependent glycine transporter 2 [Nymphon striatum]